jgi:hypothetical protein
MTLPELKFMNGCSAGTIANLTGLDTNNEIAAFTRWVNEHSDSIPSDEDVFTVIRRELLIYSTQS